jgi:hypothetical protein
MRVYLIFYKKLLERTPLNAKLATDIDLKDNKYKVKEIKDLQKVRS